MKIALVAGEASGDQLGAELIAALRARLPEASFAGIGGPRMMDAGFAAWWQADELAVMGLAEVLRHLPRLLQLRRSLIARMLAWQPDVYVGIDAPDFNLGVERRLKHARLRTVHYVSPSVWAWREGRAARIGRAADLVLCLFPIEPPIYARHHIDARYVGHPLADRFPLEPDRAAARRRLGLADKTRMLALLPGSRGGEVARLGEVFARAALQVAHALPGLRVLAPMASPACREVFVTALDRAHARGLVELHDGQAHEIMLAADVVLVASGTAALEALLAKRPMVVGYKLSPLTAIIVRALRLMRVDRYSLPNVLAGEALVPELIQERCTPERLASAVLDYLRDDTAAAKLAPRFTAIHRLLRCGASERAAEAVAELLGAPPAAHAAP